MIASLIITYNPKISQLDNKINYLVNSKKTKILVIDNNSSNKNEIKNYFNSFRDPSIFVIFNDVNIGLSSALNQGFDFIFKFIPNINWILTLDQDTLISKGYLNYFYENLISYNLDKVAVIAPQVNLIGKSIKQKKVNKWSYVNFAITSGCFIKISSWIEIGGFDDYLFIDGIDHDYCIRLIKNNYKIIKLTELVIDQTIGSPKIYNLFGLKEIYVFNHNFLRKFFIVRNRIYLTKKHKMNWILSFFSLLKIFLFLILFEDDKIKKIYFYFKGFIYGFKS